MNLNLEFHKWPDEKPNKSGPSYVILTNLGTGVFDALPQMVPYSEKHQLFNARDCDGKQAANKYAIHPAYWAELNLHCLQGAIDDRDTETN